MAAPRRWRREVTGPFPHSVALRAKLPNQQPSESLFSASRQKEQELLENTKLLELYNRYRSLYEWQQRNEQKWLHSAVQRKVAATMQEYLAGVEERRERLRELLEVEERSLLAEMKALEETAEERQGKMRERVKFLREKREKEREQLVAEKREQQFREQCEELRLQWMKKHQKELCKDRLAQLALKDQLRQRWREEERMFAELWEEDRLAKEKREAAATQKSAEQSREVLKALGAQVAALSAHKEEAERLKEEEARWLEEEQRQLKLENERLQIVKLEKQKERRETLLSAARDKTNHLTEEKEGELALEVKLLEQSLREPQEDAEEKAKEKSANSVRLQQELFKEQQAYLAHLAKQLEEDKQREKEADKLLEEETAKVWAKKAEQMRSEKEARKQLLKDVLRTRQAQVEEKLQRNTKEQEELAQEQKLLAEAIAELERTEEEKYARKLKEAKEHQEQLRAQIAQRQQARAAEEEEKQREYEAVLAAERAFRERVQDLLARPCESGAKTHPLRRKLASSSPDDPSR